MTQAEHGARSRPDQDYHFTKSMLQQRYTALHKSVTVNYPSTRVPRNNSIRRIVTSPVNLGLANARPIRNKTGILIDHMIDVGLMVKLNIFYQEAEVEE